ncbi:MAG: N-acetylmuramoyl-L-alanine amidase [Bacteroides sp.]|nr:N-acetylmuramoyl-L-alanine amidase [Bacteroides sp.]
MNGYYKKRLAAAAAAFMMCLSPLSAYAEEADASETAGETQDNVTVQQQVASNFTMPKNQRATIITPTVDFLSGEAEDRETAEEELDALFGSLSEIGLNSVYINTVYDGTAYYSTDMNNVNETDYSAIALAKAYEHNFRAYMVFDMGCALKQCEESADVLDSLISVAHRFALKYRCDGIVIDNYYSAKNTDSYSDYMQNGSGVGYDNYLYDSNELYFSAVSDVIHITDNTVPVGIFINDMWANSDSNEEGSETSDPVQALYDGFSDTRKYIGEGYADFCLVKAYGSMTSSLLPFEKVTGWWNDLSDRYGIAMYVVHFNERQGEDMEGWNSVDQILRQLSVSKELSSFGGSVFHSCGDLLADTSLKDNIVKFYGDAINEDSLFEELKMQSPTQLSFDTYEPFVDFMGTFDENFDVYFNGQMVTLNSAGNFYFEEPLEIGMNTFTIDHKDKTYTYNIRRKIITITALDESIEEGKSLSVNGGTKIEISCTAYKGSTVTATLNGKTVSLSESEGKQDSDINSYYTRFTGSYTVPEGIISQEQELGSISVTATHSGYSGTLYGASVKVIALPEPPKVDINVDMGDQSSAGSGEVVGTIDPIRTEDETVQYVRISNDYTVIYNGSTAGSMPTPDYAQLPAGTLDYLLTSSGDYYITESNKRVKKTDATSFTDTGLGKNALTVNSTGSYNSSSYIRFGLDYKISYNIDIVGNNYYTGGDGGFDLFDFTATHIYITFDNVTSVTKLPDFENNFVFSEGKWETVTVDGIPKFRLVLKLRQKGVYAGCGASYNSNGELVLSFGITTNKISDMTIVIDPGHGYCKSSTLFDGGAVGYIVEYDSNKGVAVELESQLKALGANAIRIKTDEDFVLTRQRPAYGRERGCDMFISIHGNKVPGSPSVRGTEVYYFTSYSQPLAAAISAQISDYFTNSVYSDGANKNRGAKWSYYIMTLEQDFPSVMIEVGFVTNEEDALAMANPNHQKNIASRIVKGIQAYIGRSNLSYSGNSSTTVEFPPVMEFETPAATEAPEETSETAAEENTPDASEAPEETEETGDFFEFDTDTDTDTEDSSETEENFGIEIL